MKIFFKAVSSVLLMIGTDCIGRCSYHTTEVIISSITCLNLDMASDEMNSFLVNLVTKHRTCGLLCPNPCSSSQGTYTLNICVSCK